VNDERVWILQAQHGSDEAFARLVEKYQTPVYNLCYRMLSEPEIAEEAAQETFLRAFQGILRYDSGRPFATWLLSIAAHYCIDSLRRRKLNVISIDDDDVTVEIPDVGALNPEVEAVRSEERDQLNAMLRSLDAIDRAAIVLRYWYDFSEAEIAQSLSLTVSAVKSRLHRTRRVLGRMWQDESSHTGLERIPHESPAF
jgi:RNA polymerase sigma-70 factor (ECF subfamily)